MKFKEIKLKIYINNNTEGQERTTFVAPKQVRVYK